jgi:anti-sigma factor RsiW
MSARDDDLFKHIAAIASQSRTELARLSESLRRGSWPAGDRDDRREPGAVPWLQRWRPLGTPLAAPPCGCASGRCLVCN